MNRLSPLEVSFFVMESPDRPMHGGGVMLFDPPPDGKTTDMVDRVVTAFRATAPVAPWDRRPVMTLGSLPHWETVGEVEIDYHVRRVALPAPGTQVELMKLVSHLYQALLDRSRPLWEAYVVEGLEQGRWALFVKAHHSLADGVGGLQLFYRSLSEAPNDDPRPVWGVGPDARSCSEHSNGHRGLRRVGNTVRSVVGVAGTPPKLLSALPETLRLAATGGALPSFAAKMPTMAARITSARSFAAFDLPLREVKEIGTRFGATVNDVVLSVCDDAMQRYVAETGGAAATRMVSVMPISVRAEGDQSGNAAGGTLLALGPPDATPAERLAHIVAVTQRVKSGVRRASPLAFQLQTISMLAAMELREQLPIGRGLVPNVANFILSNVSGGPKEALFLGQAKLRGFYATPIVSGSQAANFTLIPYRDLLCVGVGAARNIISDTPRLAALALQSFVNLRASAVTEIVS